MQPRIATVQLWPNVLTDYINTKYGVSLKSDNLKFNHNIHYPVKPNVKVIDVVNATDATNNAVFQIVPYDAATYFNNIPILIESLIPLKGSDIIRELEERYSIMFDTDVDISPEFMETEFTPDDMVDIPIADTSFIWSGVLSIELREPGKDISKSVMLRDLDALLLPDVVEEGTQSLKLILWPTPIESDELRRLFSSLDDVVIDETLANLLMDICKYKQVLDVKDIPDVKALLLGQTLISHVDGTTVYRYTADPLTSDRFSGTPVFRCEYLSDKLALDTLCSPIDMSQYVTPNSNWLPYTQFLNTDNLDSLTELLNMQMQWVPADVTGIQSILHAIQIYGQGVVFSGLRRSVKHADYSKQYLTIYIDANAAGPFTGALEIHYPLPQIALEGMLNGKLVTLTDDNDVIIEPETAKFVLTDKQLPLTSSNHLNNSPLSMVTIINLSFINADFSLQSTVNRTVTDGAIEYRSTVDPIPVLIELTD